ncbi:hypothetical protein HMPREF9080_01221 [Cardiobacterium valvarum F0432]|uniref:Uncharacterized protein n=1 Tax=Cardiobacterium valvarum F0432 TaxID=797473 RepID=G9ZEP2_9GAMM|nr:hypothetical protein HMPREF9080_01221 [Cardiobacterium valvarum F0432]
MNTSGKSLLLQALMLGFMIKRTRAQQKTVACQALSCYRPAGDTGILPHTKRAGEAGASSCGYLWLLHAFL